MENIVRDAGYTILVFNKYLLCGTNRDSHFKEIDNLGISNPRQYKSVKILLNNVSHHLFNTFPELDEILLKNGFVKASEYYMRFVPDHSPAAIRYLIGRGAIKIIKVSQLLSVAYSEMREM